MKKTNRFLALGFVIAIIASIASSTNANQYLDDSTTCDKDNSKTCVTIEVGDITHVIKGVKKVEQEVIQ